jgi:predicted metal-dependent RNase
MRTDKFANTMINPAAQQEAVRRHIVIDNANRTIWIQVLQDITGKPRVNEAADIQNGLYPKYLPTEIREQIINEVNQGFTVRPMINIGHKNEEYYIIQMVDIKVNDGMLLRPDNNK